MSEHPRPTADGVSPAANRPSGIIYSAAPRAAVPVTVVPLGPNIVVGNRLLARTVLEQTFRERGGVIVADLTDVAYVDASGLGALVTAQKTIRRQGGDLELAGLNEETRTLFEITRLDTLFRIQDRAPEPTA